MIEVSGIRIPLRHFGTTPESQERALRREASRACGVAERDVRSLELRRLSFDARHRGSIVVVATVRVSLAGGNEQERRACAHPQVRLPKDAAYALPAPVASKPSRRPVVVGAGCAGLFCALALAEAGLEPLLVERGQDATRRGEAIRRFERDGILDPESNVQFGLGGAGTYSDGKLSTGTKSPAHHLILETFVEAGASRRILYDAHPHVGSDVLPTVVESLRSKIEAAGGEVALGWRMSDLRISGGRVAGIVLEGRDPETGEIRERIEAADRVVLACGHSARDVYKLLEERGVALERKPFAMGVRIEHLQSDIDRALWGPEAGNPVLGAASYKLACHLPDGRGVFSFCMCPGGRVMAAASEVGGVVTNGASDAARDGANANAGLLVGVSPEDIPGDGVLGGMALQRSCEQAAFAAGGGGYVAPAQLVGDFLQGVPSSAAASVEPTYPRGVAWGTLDGTLPDWLLAALREAIPRLGHRLKGFDAADAVLTGVETRSSSPVRIVRGSDLQSVSTPGLWPCGEGAGYAGGIMSAAADGLRVAEAVVASVADATP